MTLTTALIVLLSAFIHAWWNFRLKRVGGSQAVVGLSKVAEALIFAPLFLWFGLPAFRGDGATGVLIAGGAAFTLANYVLLGMAYHRGPLSVMYPVSRGAMLLFLPVLGYFLIGERIGALGVFALVLILAGITIIQVEASSESAASESAHRLAPGGIVLALLCGMAGAGGALWDKRAVAQIAPFAYFYSYTVIIALAYLLHLLRQDGVRALCEEWRTHRGAIVEIGIANTVSYMLVLYAFQTGVATYVIALRQISIVFGVLLGWRLLGEPLGRVKLGAVAVILVGCGIIAATR